MKRGRSPSVRSRAPASASPAPPASPLAGPLSVLVVLAAAGAIVLAVSFRFFDYDLWEHLVVGKYLWTVHRIPTTQLWTWPTWGEPALVPSWAFRFVLWPFWSLGGETGLWTWRVLAALAACALLFVAARRRCANPSVTLAFLVLAALAWRGRTRVRPEALAFVLFAAQLVLLAAARGRERLRDAGLVAIALVWINVHLSFYLGFANLLFHALGESTRAARTRLFGVMLAAFAVSFLNPFGWRGVFQPLDVLLHHRGEAIYRSVAELGGLDPAVDLGNGLLVLLVAWPVLLALRWRRRGFDVTETLTCALLAVQTQFGQRFRGFFAIAAAVWMARDFTDLFLSGPATATVDAARRVSLGSLGAIVALAAWMALGQPEFPIGTGLDWSAFPVRACDFIAAAGIRGRAFDSFWYGGYMEARFWPERARLPFVDGHLESGSEHDRTLVALTLSDRAGWTTLDRERHFDFALVDVRTPASAPLLEAIDADPAWSAVFIDDAAAVFVRRTGALRAAAERDAYRTLRVAPAALDSLLNACGSDATLRRRVRGELERQVAGSSRCSVAHELLASLDDLEGRGEDAREERARAAAVRATHRLPELSVAALPAR